MKTRYLIISLVVFLIAGCSRPYSAKPLSALKIFEDRQQSALDSSDPSWKTEQQLRLLFLDEEYEKVSSEFRIRPYLEELLADAI